ncbi:thiamine phosphate synthase [Erythrobacter alti]|uniref:thiamine phosphate synthase n=1 Tax=Erythrobacter alti TaxID=1896145 RepID=UPI0030F38C6B
MSGENPLPNLWLLSDERNDAGLEAALARLPTGSGFVYRHYHLGRVERRGRFDKLKAIAHEHGHRVILARGDSAQLEDWGADGLYTGTAEIAGPRPEGYLWLTSAHNGDELRAANEAGADAVFLSPVFPTRSHSGATTLGVFGFSVLAQQSLIPVIALGGMTAERAQELGWPRWGAIDGLS